MVAPSTVCPHCKSRLKKWRVPPGSSWDQEFFLVCFNDACSYYQEGWNWMQKQYGQHTSYRYAIDPATGAVSMIPVWSDAAARELIVEETDE